VLTLTMTDGDSFTIHRKETSQNVEVDYRGTIAPDGKVRGTGQIRGGYAFPWSAQILP
jgi:hypothetical protein